MESQLIPRAKTRDPEALAQLLVDLAPLTKSTIRRIQPYAQDPDNLYGEANLILLDALDDFNPERGVPFHLYYRTRLSYFLMDDLKRSMKKTTVPLTNEMEAVVADVAKTEEDFILLERAEELHQIVNDLPLRERAVVSLYFFCHHLFHREGVAQMEAIGVVFREQIQGIFFTDSHNLSPFFLLYPHTGNEKSIKNDPKDRTCFPYLISLPLILSNVSPLNSQIPEYGCST